MEYCLIEEWKTEYSLPSGSKAVAVTPKACHELERCGIEYFIFEDFCPQSKTRKEDVDEYMIDQLSWFEKFDEFIQKMFPDAKQLNLKLALLYYFNIKRLADHLISNLKVLNSFIDAATPSKIWYVGEINGEDKCDKWYWFHYGKNSYFRLIGSLCKKRGIIYEELIVSQKDESIKKLSQDPKSIFADPTELKKLIKIKLPWLPFLVRKIKNRYIHWKNTLAWQSSIFREKGRILVITDFSYTYQFLKDASKHGYSLCFFENGNVYSSSLFSKAKKIQFGKKENVRLRDGYSWDEVVQKLLQGPIMKWINEKCDMDVSDILRLRFEYLIKDLFPETIVLMKGFSEYYNSNGVDYVFTNILSSSYDFAAMAAARISKKTKSVGFFHGVDAYEVKHRYFMENYHFDLYFTSTRAEAEHIKKLRNDFKHSHPTVSTFPYFRDQFNLVAKTREQMSDFRKQRKNQIVLFLSVIRKYRSHADYIKEHHWKTMELIRWHSAIVDFFSSRIDCEFIWKDVSQSKNTDDSMMLKFQDNEHDNVIYENKALKEYLPRVDKVICDGASTGFFECIFSGVPVIAFYDKENNTMREDAPSMLGASLQSYSTLDEKLKIVEKFLDDEPEKYIVSLPEAKTSVVKVLDDHLCKT
jgi:hypothetical protein